MEPGFDQLKLHHDESAASVANKIDACVEHFARHRSQCLLGNRHGSGGRNDRFGLPAKLRLHTKVATGRALDDGMGERSAEIEE